MYRQTIKLFVVLFIAIASVIIFVDYFYSQIESRSAMEQDVGAFWNSVVKPLSQKDVNFSNVGSHVPVSQLAWPNEKIFALKKQGFLLHKIDDSTYLFHGYVPRTDKVFIKEVVLENHSDSQWLWWLIIYGLLAIVILWWLFPLIRDVKKLKDAAIEFGESKRYNPVTVRESSAVLPIANALSQMTSRINRLMSLQRDIATYALHDIRTPLSRIRFASELINDPIALEIKHDIGEEIDEVEALLKELLRYAEFEYTKPNMLIAHTNLYALCEEVCSKFRVISAIGIENLLPKDIGANLEYKLFKRALANLVSNCLRYAETRIWISIEVRGHWYCIVVEDDGPGIDSQELQNVKAPFKRIENTEDQGSDVNNSGLGLAIVETICLWHGGKFNVGSSNKYGGARFVMQWNSNALKDSSSEQNDEK